ncbi:MAG: hypothetical protein HAW67_06920 [Endozoicomonadaceae bacterium]|nr:hypothetical protein [Endozoicomonadaceae bacterium]
MSKFSAYTWGRHTNKVMSEDQNSKFSEVYNARGSLKSKLSRSKKRLALVEEHNEKLYSYVLETMKKSKTLTSKQPILDFVETGKSDTFDVGIIDNPADFLEHKHFPISCIPYLFIEFSLSVNQLIDKNYDKDIARLHNMNMTAIVQSIVGYHKNPKDLAQVSLDFYTDPSKFTKSDDEKDLFIESLNIWGNRVHYECIKTAHHKRFLELARTKVFNFNDAPNNYLFEQKLAISGFGDLKGNQIEKVKLKQHLKNACPLKQDYKQFDFLGFFFIPKELFSLPKELIPIAIHHHFNSPKIGKHGIMDLVGDDIKSEKRSFDYYTMGQ